jgi:antitoxin component of MazEF toxin-antitoxin module
MASQAARNTQYVGKVLADGHLEIPKTIVAQLGLQQGDEVVVALQKVTSRAPETLLREETQTLIQELIGTPGSLEETVAALTAVATEMLPQKQQRRLTHLLWKNQDGTLTAQEEQALDTLVAEGQHATLRKAKAIVALQRLGIDIIPDLAARVRNG